MTTTNDDNVVHLADYVTGTGAAMDGIARATTYHEINLIVETALLADCLRADGALSKRDFDAIEKTISGAASRAICEANDPVEALRYFIAACETAKQAVREATT